MMIRLFTVSAAVLLLISLAVPVAGVAVWEPEDFIVNAIINPSPGYAMKAEDYLTTGNLYREACAREKQGYDRKVQAFLDSGGVFTPEEIAGPRNPDPVLNSCWKAKPGANDEGVAASYERMMTACGLADRNYNKALELTKDDDYVLQAEIFDSGAGIYDTLGMTKEAEQVRDAGAVARAHAAAADLFLPLSPLAAVAGLLGAVFLAGKKR